MSCSGRGAHDHVAWTFDLTGGPFLELYGILFGITIVAGFLIPRWLRPDGYAGRVTDTANSPISRAALRASLTRLWLACSRHARSS